MFMQHISVPFEYPVCFTRRIFDAGNPLLADVIDRLKEDRRHRAVVYIDAALAAANPQLSEDIKEYFHARGHEKKLELAAPPVVVPGGEQAKNDWAPVREILWTIGNLHLDRKSFVIAVGGGSMLDMVGFAASIVHRGLRIIRVPSTTLAQDDAGLGVKTGMNEHGAKNFVGTMAPPFAVLNDFSLLSTLELKDWLGGVAEAFKVAIIKDSEFFDFLCENAAAFRDRQAEPMEQLIRRCAMLHLRHIRDGGDPFEFGSARPLDFGHWAAHKLEVMSDYSIGHGQAVAVGIAVDSYYAMKQGLISPADFDRIITGLLESGLPVWCEQLSMRGGDGELAVLDGLVQFREHLGGSLCVTLPDGIGNKIEVHHVDTDIVEQAVGYLKSKANAAAKTGAGSNAKNCGKD